MSDPHALSRKYHRIFWIFILVHVVGWTLTPMLARVNLPMDSIEGVVWAQKLVFGYEKAPLLNAWVTALALKLWGYTDVGIYLTSQIAVAICFIALWQLAKKILPLPYALLSILLLEGFQYYNVGAIDFDDNVLQLPLWALSCLFFYKALVEKKTIYWFFLGIFTALSILAKYYAGLLLAAMLIFLLIRENRSCWSEKGPYIAAFVFLVLISPHVLWLFHNDFLTVRYVFQRIGDAPVWKNHIINPLLFLRDEVYALIIPSLLFSTLFFDLARKNRILVAPETKNVEMFLLPHLNNFQRKFLIYLTAIPFFLAIMLSCLTAIKLHIMWGSALFSLCGILLMGFVAPQLNSQKIVRFLGMLTLLFLIAQIGYVLSLRTAKNTSSAHFPGQLIATELTNAWHQRYHKPLAYVVGSRWLAGNIAFYSVDHPIVLTDGNLILAPWLQSADFKSKGALFVWDANEYGNNLPSSYRYLAGKQMTGTIKAFPWYLAPTEKPVKIGFLFFYTSQG
jgi:hypothetical protein